MNAELDNIWSRVQSELLRTVPESTYRIWLEPLKAHDLSSGRLAIEVSAEASDWVRRRYGRLLQLCAEHVIGERVTVELVSVCDAQPTYDQTARATARAPSSMDSSRHLQEHSPTTAHTAYRQGGMGGDALAADRRGGIGMLSNPKLTFDQFVIGDCNRLAHAAALAVAEMPAQAYNPLFICGPPGVGKTHLLSSIASLLLAHSPGLAVHTTTGEAFTNEFLGALSGQHTSAFKTHHRRLDVLLVDDVQFLERKTRTEEEFFHTFNALYDSGSQIVLTSDRPPRDLRALEDRLRERFESGLVADIRPPDPATRMTILRKRVHHDQLQLSDDTPLHLIAERVTDNVRALQGALIRLVAFSSLTRRPVTADLTREVLDNLYPPACPHPPRQPPSIADIIAATCDHYGLTPDEIVSPSRAPRITWPRQVAMYLARELTGQSLPSIGRVLGDRDHTTVLHACRRAASRIASDDSSRRSVDQLLAHLAPSTDDHDRHLLDRSA